MTPPDFAGALEQMAQNIHRHVELLTTRLRQRTDALSRVVAERDAYRKALVAVLQLETYEAGESGTDWLARDEVHDAIGGDLIGMLMYRPRIILPAGITKEEAEALYNGVADGVTAPHAGMNWAEWAKDVQLTVAEPPHWGTGLLPGEPDYARVRRLMDEHGRAWGQAFRIALDEQELGELGDPMDWRDAEPKTLAGVADTLAQIDKITPLDSTNLGPYLDKIAEMVGEFAEVEEVIGKHPCTCTIDFNSAKGASILDREATCSVHGAKRCLGCNSDSPDRSFCTKCRKPCLAPRYCSDRWHES